MPSVKHAQVRTRERSTQRLTFSRWEQVGAEEEPRQIDIPPSRNHWLELAKVEEKLTLLCRELEGVCRYKIWSRRG